MLNNPSAGQRAAGKLMILGAMAVALPLTATRAVEYVDVPPPPAAPAPPRAPATLTAPAAAAIQAIAPVAPVPPVAPVAPVLAAEPRRLGISGDTITLNGRTRRWEELTPAEKQEIRRELAEAREELARTSIDRAEIEREVREALEDARLDGADLHRDVAAAKIEIAQALREVDANAVHIRSAGHDPETIKARVRASLKAVEAIDVEAIRRQALASVDPARIAASVAAAEGSLARAQAEIDRIEERLQDD